METAKEAGETIANKMHSIVFTFTYLMDERDYKVALEKAKEEFRRDLVASGFTSKNGSVKRLLPNRRVAIYGVAR